LNFTVLANVPGLDKFCRVRSLQKTSVGRILRK
jgi:hypothetical protein